MSCYRGQFGRVWLGAVGVLLLSATTTTAAQDGKAPWEEYDKLISANKAVTTLGPQMFGDSVDLISGALTFATTDVSITGNNALPVAVTRTFRVISDKEAATYAFGDWDIDIPNISGLFAPTWHNNRCDQAVPPSVVVSGQTTADSVAGTRYWKGNTVNMPGGGDLMLMDASSPHPSTGGPYTWITPGRTVFSCLATIKNGSGQGFLAITTDGTQYWFDYLAQYEAASYEDTYQVNNTDNPGDTNPPAKYETATVTRKKNALYATRVQDRFGNWVTYTYTNAYNQPLKVSAITASDGRNITFHYNGNLIDSVSTGSGTWTYQYSGPFLTGVVQPDSGRWAIAFSAFSNADIQYAGTSDPNGRTCFRLGSLDTLYSGPYTGTITHPSGAVGTFTVAPTIHSRTNVPAICENYVAQSVDPAVNDYNDPTNDYAIFPIKWHAMSLISKTITGPGLPTQAWSFNYASGASWYYPDGGTEPICKTTTCADPVCLSDDCAGVATTTMIGPNAEWTRHTFGNSYRYNEGKLLKIEEGLDQV